MSRRGIALALVLVVAGLLVMLTTCFLIVNRSHFAMLSSGEDQERASRVVDSAFHYCLYRLENDKAWATTTFSGQVDSEVEPLMTVEEVSDTTSIEGEIPDLKGRFTVDIRNQLAGGPETVELTIVASSGSRSRTVEVTLREAPVYDSGAATSGDLLINANRWIVGSTDPYRNIVRAQGTISAPHESALDFVGVTNAGGDTGTDKGVLWSEGEIFLAAPRSVTDPTVMQSAVSSTGGRFLPETETGHQIYPLDIDRVNMPSSTASVAPGDYVFGELTASFETYDQVGDTGFPDYSPVYAWVQHTRQIPGLERVVGGTQDYWYNQLDLPAGLRNLDFSGMGSAVPHPQVTDVFAIAGNMYADIDNPTLRLDAGGTITVDGDFGVRSADGPVNFDLSGTLWSDQPALVATGTIRVQGPVDGMGVLVAEGGDVDIDINAANVAPGQMGLTIFAGNDVLLETATVGPVDNVLFNGLVYAEHDFRFTNSTGTLQNLRIEGALVARTGNIEISGVDELDFTYNPDFLELLLEDLPDDNTVLEVVLWKE